MSLAVEQTLPHREVQVEVGRSKSERHAAESFIIDAAPTMASGRAASEEEALRFASATPLTKPQRASYDMQPECQDAMDVHELNMSPSDQRIVKEQAPVLPQRSALRASRLLVDLKMSPSAEPLAFTQTHHEEYLSSEEDASSTSGDFSDFEYDSSSDDGPSPSEDCSKHVTARVVSVVYSGKPSVIDVPQVRRSISPNSIERPMSMSGLSDKASYTSVCNSRRTSVSTTTSSRSARSLHPQRPLPPRSSSMQPPTEAMKAKLGFLRIDPYANRSSYYLAQSPAGPLDAPEIRTVEEVDRPKTPKSPAVNMFKGVARAMSIMKRRSSPRLSQAYLSTDVEPLSQPASPLSVHEELSEDSSKEDDVAYQARKPESETTTVPPMPTRPPPQPFVRPSVTHDEIIRIAKRNELNNHLTASQSFQGDVLDSPISPESSLAKNAANPATKRMSSFGFARRRMSVKLPGGKFQL